MAPAAAIPLIREAALTNDVLPPLVKVPATAPLDVPMTGIFAEPLASVTTAPVDPDALFVIVAAPLVPLIRAATAVFDRLLPPAAAAAAAAALALLAALMTAA